MKKVLIFGTFDGIHDGHRKYFSQAREHGDYLSAVVARDETVRQIKGRLPKYDERQRIKDLAKEEMIDHVVLGLTGDKYEIVRLQKPDVICLGYDQRNFTDGLREELDRHGMQATEVVRSDAYKPEIYKSSIINSKPNNKVIK